MELISWSRRKHKNKVQWIAVLYSILGGWNDNEWYIIIYYESSFFKKLFKILLFLWRISLLSRVCFKIVDFCEGSKFVIYRSCLIIGSLVIGCELKDWFGKKKKIVQKHSLHGIFPFTIFLIQKILLWKQYFRLHN